MCLSKESKNNGNNRNRKSSNHGMGRFLLIFTVLIAVILMIAFAFNSQPNEKYLYSDIMGYFERLEVKAFQIDLTSGKLQMQLRSDAKIQSHLVYNTDNSGFFSLGKSTAVKSAEPNAKHKGLGNLTKDGDETNGAILTYDLPDISIFWNMLMGNVGNGQSQNLINAYNEKYPDNPIVYNYGKSADNSWLFDFIPTLILIVIMIVFWMFIMRRMSGLGDPTKTMGFGKAKIKNLNDEKRKTTFADVAGADEEKEELEEIVEFLKDGSRFSTLGARIPKGVLLVGPPGTGKTLLARAVAGEAGVPFFSISGSDFVEMFVGVGASRVRDLFDQAKKNSPCIIFIDEIDAVGRQRGAGVGGGNDEREQTLNQLLVEMDGFGINEGIIIIAATNRPDVLDPALMRPGRFDRQVVVNYPDIKGREAILRVHANMKKSPMS